MSAKQKLSPLRSRGLLFLCLVLLVFLAALPSCSRADSLEDAAQNLARKICTAPRQQSVKINWQTSPELSGSLSDSLKKTFISQLSACGMATDSNAEFPLLNIALRGTASKLLLVANLVDPGGSRQIRITEIRRDALSVPNSSSETPRLQTKLLWKQESPLESAMEWYGPTTREHFLFLVGRTSIVRLRSTNEVWTQMDSAELPKVDRPSRLEAGASTFLYGNSEAEAKLDLFISRPGPPPYQKRCEFAPAGSLSLTCNDSHLGGKQPGIFSECGNVMWFLREDNGDFAQRDRIVAESGQMAEAEIQADESASHSLDMSGPVLDISATFNSKAAIVVVRNLSTGNYEVHRITLACGN